MTNQTSADVVEKAVDEYIKLHCVVRHDVPFPATQTAVGQIDWLQTTLTKLTAEARRESDKCITDALQKIYDEGLLTVSDIKERAEGWGREGSDIHRGYVEGAKEIQSLVIWALSSFGLTLDFKPKTPPTA